MTNIRFANFSKSIILSGEDAVATALGLEFEVEGEGEHEMFLLQDFVIIHLKKCM